MDKNTNKNFMVSCSCGCSDAMEAKTLDDQIYVSFLSSDYYTNQKHGRFRLAALLFCGKTVLKDILCTEDDLKQFKKFLLSVEYKEEHEEKNDSHIVIDYDEDFGLSIMLISDQKRWKAWKFKNHRLFDIALSKSDRDVLVRRINHALKKAKEQNKS